MVKKTGSFQTIKCKWSGIIQNDTTKKPFNLQVFIIISLNNLEYFKSLKKFSFSLTLVVKKMEILFDQFFFVSFLKQLTTIMR